MKKAYFAGGCFWGVEYYMKKITGVISVTSGFMGGHVENPTYRQVCDTNTGHAETVEIVYDSAQVSFGELAKRFFEIHDPTQVDRQGPDIGPQYRSAIFVADENEREIVDELILALETNGYDVVTEIENVGVFYPAEDYHQNYYAKTGKHPYCHAPVERF
ncbi:peptide-methionine (S)-S-oxide reductase MsrA [Myxococcota bacterium]|nr:peptide-methionine (S)-S-oxide reductase MsrA [Myxococcota bacterium]MBU1382905.1 peptide-methionine (S)-S-oxide reductase MsrA [Myxococcota bacterium]MBU1495389.1 peptide-methionine (S)-S-oxide reductase MsrA [Myxococcota bacterium]